MYVKTKEAGDVKILEPHGKLRLGDSITVFEKAVDRVLDEDHKQIVLNLKYVPEIDSSGTGAIIGFCYKRARDRGAVVKAVIPTSSRLNLYVRFCIMKVLGAHESELQAVGEFTRRTRASGATDSGRALRV